MSSKVILFYPKPWPGQTMSGRLPYSLMILQGYLRGTDYDVRIVDERMAESLDAAVADADGALCFGISSFTGVQIENGLAIARLLKERYPSVPIVWGGWHPSCLPEQTLEHPLVDMVVRGQGEVTFRELLDALRGGHGLDSVKGLSFRRDGKMVHNPQRDLTDSIAGIRMDFGAVDLEKYIYRKPYAGRAGRTIGIITSLGCPFNCGFCAVAGVYKKRVFYRDMDIILGEVDYLVREHGIESLTIDDDNFFVSRKRVEAFCTALIEKDYNITWDAGVSVNLLLENYDDALLSLIRRSGCEQLYIGAESGSNAVMEKVGKRARVEHTYAFVRKMKEAGINAFFSTMVGLPGVPRTEVFDTMNMILTSRDINPDVDFRIFYYTPYPATPLYEEARQAGFEEPASLEEWSRHTLRKFKAPWVKRSYRAQVKYFAFYYFPYSSEKPWGMSQKLWPAPVEFLYRIMFENAALKALARWRVRQRYFGLPLDAMFVCMGRRMKSWYDLAVNGNVDIFREFDA